MTGCRSEVGQCSRRVFQLTLLISPFDAFFTMTKPGTGGLMRFTLAVATLFATVLLVCAPARARQQQTGLVLSVETGAFSSASNQRVPAMIVHDAALPAPKPAPLPISDSR